MSRKTITVFNQHIVNTLLKLVPSQNAPKSFQKQATLAELLEHFQEIQASTKRGKAYDDSTRTKKLHIRKFYAFRSQTYTKLRKRIWIVSSEVLKPYSFKKITMHRFYINPAKISNSLAVLEKREARHLRDVLRLGKGSRVELIDGQGFIYEAVVVNADKHGVALDITGRRKARLKKKGIFNVGFQP